MRNWPLILLAVFLLSKPLIFAWVLRRNPGAAPMWKSATREERGAMVALRETGYILLGISFLMSAFIETPVSWLLPGMGALLLGPWPFRLLITRWIK